MNFCTSTFNKKRFILLSFALAITGVLIQFLILEYFTRTKIVVEDKQTIELNKIKEDFYLGLLGTSHTNYGNEMMKLNKNMFDYGSSYTYPIVMFQKTKKLIEVNPSLKYLILEADYHQYYDFSYTQSTIYTKYAYLLKNINTGNEDMFYSLNREIAPTLHKRIINGIKSRVLGTNINKKDKKDIDWSILSQEERDRSTYARFNFFKFSKTKSMNKNSLDYYEKTINLAKENNIEVILIRHPLANEYLNYMYPNMKKEVDKYIDKLQTTYNLKLIDFRNIFKDKQELFSNQDHLNKIGQKEFSRILVNTIENDFISK